MMRNRCKLILITTIFAVVLGQEPSPRAADLPTEHGRVKSSLDEYARAIDFLSDDQLAARKRLQSMVDQLLPELKHIFIESDDDNYRTAIAGLFRHAKLTKRECADFLEGQLKGSAEWNLPKVAERPKTWIRATFDFIVDASPEQARGLSLQAISSRNLFVQAMALKSLSKVGRKEDTARITEYADTGNADGTSEIPSELREEAKETARQIVQRDRCP